MTTRDFLNQLISFSNYEIVKKSKDRLSGTNLHRDIGIILKQKKSPLLLDVGSNYGQTIRKFRMDFDRPTIIGFEPDPTCYESLKRHFLKEDLTLENLGLGNENTTAEFKVYEVNGLQSFLDVSDQGMLKTSKIKETLSVEIKKLDDYVAAKQITTIDLLKMDVQGYELNVLKGAAKTLERHAIQVIYTEINFLDAYQGQGDFQEITVFLKTVGYHLVGIYNQSFRGSKMFHADVCYACI